MVVMALVVSNLVMNELDPALRTRTAAEFRHLLPAEQDAILAAAAQRANQDYCLDPKLTAFEALRCTDDIVCRLPANSAAVTRSLGKSGVHPVFNSVRSRV